MDLEEFEVEKHKVGAIAVDSAGVLSIPNALKWVDDKWHSSSRQARWMDLLGDYAGVEPFIIDGHSLIQLVIDDPLLALGNTEDPSFQILHAFHILERILDEFIKRSAVFDVVFWEESRHIVLMTGVGGFEETSRRLARRLLFNHLLKIPKISVHIFSDLCDSKWKEYQFLRKPMFILVNDCDTNIELMDSLMAHRLLCYRTFLCDLMMTGLALALLAGAEFRDSKVLSFVFESKPSRTIPRPVRGACLDAARVLEEHTNLKNIALYSTSISTEPVTGRRLMDVILKVVSLTNFPNPQEKALFFSFLLHLLILPRLSTQHRARRMESMQIGLQRQLTSDFLPVIFRTIEIAITSLNMTIDIDIRVFISLVRFLAVNDELSVQDIFGNHIAEIVGRELSSFSVPISTFSQFFATEFYPPSPVASSAKNECGLLPFSNKIFDDELAPIYSVTGDHIVPGEKVLEDEEVDDNNEDSDMDEWDASSDGTAEGEAKASQTCVWPDVPKAEYFDDGTLFNDTQHWHNHKRPLLPKHLGGEAPLTKMTEWQRRKKLRSDQRFMKSLHDQAATLTGASGAALHQMKIPPARSASDHTSRKKQTYTRPNSSKDAHKQSKADAIREKNSAQKAQKQLSESVAWLAELIRNLDSETSISSVEKSLLDLRRNPRSDEPLIATELALYGLHRILSHWILDPKRESASIRDRHTITALRTIKDLHDINYWTEDIRKCVREVLNVLGFPAYTNSLVTASAVQDDRPLSFRFVKLVKSKSHEPLHAFMRIEEHPIEWQLRVFGEYMDRSMDSQVDPRVSFKPDAWQREVLDAIDDNKSLLVVAPTSAGKTFISFYAMEKILRASDDGVIVYVAPTKALVAQVAAEIYARFSKDLKGRSCWAIHTRDYRIHNPQTCQILVTVPDILSIMMLSPPMAKVWSPHVKYIILDEIHTIGQQEGGSVWEQVLLLAPCPIIGLSATVGTPENFNTWLEAVQKTGGFQHTFIHHPHRYSHLRKFFYNIHQEPGSEFESVATHKSTGRMRYLHPISMLAFGPRSIPSDLALEASDTLTLYRALAEYGDLPPSMVDALNPLNFFPDDRLLQQKDVIAYDAALKACLAPMVAQFDPRHTAAPLYKVITSLEDGTLRRIPTRAISAQPERGKFKTNLIYLVCDLHAQGDLPAIFFNFDRTDCEIMAETLLCVLVTEEKKWRSTSPEWKRKMAQYEEWLSRAKDRKREAAKAVKKKRVNLDDIRTAKATEWQATFNPKAPLPQFSFTGQNTSYTQSMLLDELKDLARWTSTPEWALHCLRRGIAVHHAGMNKRYRTLVESLFRRGFIRVIFATGTLALGINAPTKTSVFCGDSPFLTALTYRQCAGRAGRRGYDHLGKVVFYCLPMGRVQRLTLSKLPSLGVNFPVTSTLILRLFNLLEGSGYAPAAVKAIQRLLRLPQVRFGSDEGKHQLLHHLRFSIDYLRRAGLLDEHGRPLNLFGIVSHLYYTEPSNLALVALLRQGVFHRICSQPDTIQAKRDFILLMSHLFGRRYLPRSYLKDENIAEVIKKSASIVILPPLSEDAQHVLMAQEHDILNIFTGYALTYATEHAGQLGVDNRLPLSGAEIGGAPTSGTAARFEAWLQGTSLRVTARSLFVANSGHDDQFTSVAELARTARDGLSLNEHAIPTFAPIFTAPTGAVPAAKTIWDYRDEDKGARHSGNPHNSKLQALAYMRTQGFALNAYILDFYTHGQLQPLSNANGIRRGDIWFMLQEFDLTLMTVRGVLEQLIVKKPQMGKGMGDEADDYGGEEEEQDGFNTGFVAADDPTEKDDESEESKDEQDTKAARRENGEGSKPSWMAERDWKVLEVVYAVTEEFNEKFKAIWA